MWNTFARGAKETLINTPCFDARPQQGQEALISNTFADSFQQQAVMDSLKSSWRGRPRSPNDPPLFVRHFPAAAI
ncbi:MAG: hypothetical protein IPM58_16375 [Nitrospira sp.]|nr:hypothetical protein [Nitrospira sp.]